MEERDDLELGKADPPRTWGGERGGAGAGRNRKSRGIKAHRDAFRVYSEVAVEELTPCRWEGGDLRSRPGTARP